jgi:hypothetical protein
MSNSACQTRPSVPYWFRQCASLVPLRAVALGASTQYDDVASIWQLEALAAGEEDSVSRFLAGAGSSDLWEPHRVAILAEPIPTAWYGLAQ